MVAVLTSILCSCGVSAVNNDTEQSKTMKEYQLNRFLGSDEEMEAFMEDALVNDFCSNIYLNEEETIMTVVATDEQRDKWIEVAIKNIEDAVKDVSAADEYSVDLNTEYTECVIRASGNRNMKAMAQTSMKILMQAEIYQVFSGIEDWSVNYTIIDSDIDKEILNVDFPKEDIDFSANMWRNDIEPQ